MGSQLPPSPPFTPCFSLLSSWFLCSMGASVPTSELTQGWQDRISKASPMPRAPLSGGRNLCCCERRWAPLRGHRWCLCVRNNPSSLLLPQLLNVNHGTGKLPNFPAWDPNSISPVSGKQPRCVPIAPAWSGSWVHCTQGCAVPWPGCASGSSWLSPHPLAPRCLVPSLLAACAPAALLAPSWLLQGGAGTSSQPRRTVQELVLCSSLQGCNSLQVP